MSGRDFYLEVAHALSGCQLVEQELKLYLTDALDLAKKCIGNRMVFEFSGQDYEDASLERLIGAFKKVTANAALVADLEKFKKERNFLSHQGIVYCLDYDQDLSADRTTEIHPRLRRIQAEAKRLRDAIHVEANTFRGYLLFEEFDGGDESAEHKE